MGVVYMLAISNFSRLSDESKRVTLQSLKSYLSTLPYEKEVKLLCLDDCSVCDIYVDGNKTQTLEGFLDKDVRTYRYENAYGFIEKEPDVFFNADGIEESVCFSYKVDSNKIGDQVLIEYKDKYYDMSEFLEATPVYNSVEEAQEAKENLANEVLR